MGGFLQQLTSNPAAAISAAGKQITNDITNIPKDISTAVTNPAKAINQTFANPGVSALTGAAISYLSGGTIDPITAAAIVGGTSAVASKSVTTGLMNGIGAYGGAGLVGSSAAIGAGATGDQAIKQIVAESETQGATNLAGINSVSSAQAAYQSGQISAAQYQALATAAGNATAATGYQGLAAAGAQSVASNPTSALTLGGGTAKDAAIALGKQALQAAAPDAAAAAAKAAASSTPTGSGAVAANQQATITPQIYSRNPIDPASLNMIGSKYEQGASPNTSEKTYFNPTMASGTPYTVDANGNVTMLPNNPASTPALTLGATNDTTRPHARGGVTRAAMGGLQMGVPNPTNINMLNPNAPMSHNLSNAYARPTQMPVPQPVMGYADAGMTTSDPMDYGVDPVTAIPANQVYAMNPATRTPYAPDVIRSVQGAGVPGLLAEQVAQAAAKNSIANDAVAQKAIPAVSMSAAGGTQGDHYHLGDYSDGGRLLRGPGDGISDSIPATIGQKQPARLADGEFVVPARIVSELGNGSTEAGARKLYAMLDRIQHARSKTVGKGKVARNSHADKYLPA